MDDGSRAVRLMVYMEDSNGPAPEFPRLSGRVSYFKETQEGEASMSDLVEQYANERAKEYASKQVLDAMASGVRSLMEKGGHSPRDGDGTAQHPRVHGGRREARTGGVSAGAAEAGGFDDNRVRYLTAGHPAGSCLAGCPAVVSWGCPYVI